jgi:aspartyl-tRNA(Asn)/glutamyl-tRNA(Gln) amidotransferase subunit A
LRIGVPQEYIPSGNSEGDLDPEVRSNFELGIQQLEKLGAKIEKVSLPHTSYAVACYYIIACAEASANLARFDGIRYTRRAPNATSLKDVYIESRVAGFGAEVQRRIMLGTFVLSSGYYDAYYTKGQQVRTLIRQDFSEAFKQCDLMVTPTAPFAAFKVGEKSDNPLQMYLSDIFTTSINLAGLPAVSVPSGFTKQGLPLGMQVIGPAMREDQILRVGYQLELVLQTRGSLPKWM